MHSEAAAQVINCWQAAADPYLPPAELMNRLNRKSGGIAVITVLLASLIFPASADDKIVTVADYYNELTNEERHQFDFDIRQSELDKMLEHGREKEAVCVLGRFVDADTTDDLPSDGIMFMWRVLDMAKREGRTDMDAERLLRGVMGVMFKQCEQDIEEGKWPPEQAND